MIHRQLADQLSSSVSATSLGRLWSYLWFHESWASTHIPKQVCRNEDLHLNVIHMCNIWCINKSFLMTCCLCTPVLTSRHPPIHLHLFFFFVCYWRSYPLSIIYAYYCYPISFACVNHVVSPPDTVFQSFQESGFGILLNQWYAYCVCMEFLLRC